MMYVRDDVAQEITDLLGLYQLLLTDSPLWVYNEDEDTQLLMRLDKLNVRLAELRLAS